METKKRYTEIEMLITIFMALHNVHQQTQHRRLRRRRYLPGLFTGRFRSAMQASNPTEKEKSASLFET